MEFEKAIIELIESHPSPYGTGKVIAENLADAMGMVLVEKPAPPERKIDKHPFQGWHKWTASRVRNADDCNVNDYSPLLADLIVNAPDTMRGVIALVNEYDRRDYKDDNWLYPYIETLRQCVIDNGFECDLD